MLFRSVDDDVDITNAEDVIWAMGTRSHADAIDIVRDVWTSPVDPMLTPEQRAAAQWTSSRALIDATRPLRWRDQFPPINQFSRARASEIRRKWGLE